MSGEVEIVEIRERETWNAALAQAPLADLLQSWEWGEFKRHTASWTPLRLLARQGSEPLAGVQVLYRRVMGAPSLYAPRGPWWRDEAALAALIRALRQRLAFRAPFLRIDPPVTDAKPLERLGFRLAPRQIQPRATIVVDLQPTPDQIMGAFDRQVRYNARLAERKGVEITQGGVELVEEFWKLLAQTAERKGFVERDVSYFTRLVEDFGDAAPVFHARFEGQLVYAALMVMFGKTAYYLYGASGGDRSVKPSELVQYRAMLWAKERGATRYDMWGIPAHVTEDNPLYGVYRFKSGFGGLEETYAGALDLSLTPLVGRAAPQMEVLALKSLALARGQGFRIVDHLA